MAEIILIATSDIKGAGIGVETINVKLTLSNDNISMNISAMFIDQETSASQTFVENCCSSTVKKNKMKIE